MLLLSLMLFGLTLICNVQAAYTKTKDHCFETNIIQISPKKLNKKIDVKKVTKKYLSKCLQIKEIKKLQQELTAAFVQAGYITTRAELANEIMESGKLKFNIIEGKLSGFTTEGLSEYNVNQMPFAFPVHKGDIITINAIEQGLENINRMSSYQSEAMLVPGKKLGESKIHIKTYIKKPTRIKVSTDNYGNKVTGKKRANISIEQDNLFGLNDQWSIYAMRNIANNNETKHIAARSVNVSIPFGYFQTTFNSSRTSYKQTITGAFQSFESLGVTDKNEAKLSRILSRSTKHKFAAFSTFSHKDTKSYLQDILLESGSYELSLAQFGVEHAKQFNQAVSTLSFSVKKGLSIWHAHKDHPNIQNDEPHAQYKAANIYADIHYPLKAVSNRLNHYMMLNAQYSPDHLFSSEQFSLGGPYSIMGFKEDSMQSDSGIVLRNTLNLKPENLTEISPYITLDMGMGRSRTGKKADANRGYGYLSGAALGIKHQSEYLDINLAYARPIKKPTFLKTDNHEIYMALSVKIGF